MVAVADALQYANVSARDIYLVASSRGKDRELLADRLNPITLLPGRGLVRSRSLLHLGQNLYSAAQLAVACVVSIVLVIRWRPRAVVSLGGYGALAMDLAAVITRTPLVLVVPDATYGGTHRVVRRFAVACCTAVSSTTTREIVTGTPIRREIQEVVRGSDHSRYEARDKSRAWNIAVMTGSLGASSVNNAVLDLAQRWAHREGIVITHVTGQRDFAAMTRRRETDCPNYQQIAFGEMSSIYATCDVAVCRAGASSVAELCFLGIPSILVPLPNAPGDHQAVNARIMSDAGASVVVSDPELSAERLASELNSLFETPGRLRDMAAAARTLRRTDAAHEIATVVLRVARG